MLRTHNLGEVDEKLIGKKVTLGGWVDTIREHGKLIFVDLRDRYGKVQSVIHFKNKKFNDFKEIFSKGLRIILIIFVPVTLGFVLLGVPVIRLFFERGAFSADATSATNQALLYYSPRLIALAWCNLFFYCFYSLKDTKTPVKAGIMTMVINIILCSVLVKVMDYKGLALANSLSEITQGILLSYYLKKKFGLIINGINIKFIGKIVCASGIMALAVLAAKKSLIVFFDLSLLPGQFFFVSLCVITGIATYTLSVFLLKLTEAKAIYDTLSEKLKELVNKG